MSITRCVGEAVIWTVSTEAELHKALQARAEFIELADIIECRHYPLYLNRVRIFGGGLRFDVEEKPENILVLQGDVWLRHLSINVIFKEGFFPDKDRMCAVVRVDASKASLGDVSIKLEAENLMGSKNSCYSGIYVLSPLKLGGSVDVDVSGEYVTAISGSGIALSRCVIDKEWAGTTTLQIWQRNSKCPFVEGCFLDLGKVKIYDVWVSRKLRFRLKRFFARLRKLF